MILFQAEAERVDRIMQIVRETAERMDPQPASIRLYGSTARREDSATSDIDLAVIGGDKDAETIAAVIRDALEQEVTDPTIMISVISLTNSGVQQFVEQNDEGWNQIQEDAITLFGSPPEVVKHC